MWGRRDFAQDRKVDEATSCADESWSQMTFEISSPGNTADPKAKLMSGSEE